MSTTTEVSILGAGRAGGSLARAISAAGVPVAAVWSRSPERAGRLAASVGAEVTATAAEAVHRSTVALLTVADTALVPVAATIAASGRGLAGRVLAHCSGSSGREVVAAARITGVAVAVWHPLQALTGEPSPALRGSAVRIDADAAAEEPLRVLSHALGLAPLAVTDALLYHAGATLLATLPVVALEQATALLVAAGVPPAQARAAALQLLRGVVANQSETASAITGPMTRGDAPVVHAHLERLAAYPEALALYQQGMAAVGAPRETETPRRRGEAA